MKNKVIRHDATSVTPQLIREVKAKYCLTWRQMHERMGYTANANMLYHAQRNPDKYLNKFMRVAFVKLLHTLEQTNNAD